MKKTFSLLMLRPDKQFYEGEVSELSVVEPCGRISILPGHMPMFINITTDMAKLTEADGAVRSFATGEGMVAIYGDRVVLQSDFLAWEEKLDEAIKRRETAMAQEKERRKQSFLEYRINKIEMAKTFINLEKNSK
ncbi:MAG: F0F1 ATP synthase subunit epsilon [Firmicutes bacterium]|jgi:ATP synthase F1, epsilon subunit|nr:F0F1 ATP synthase subunit epsilon [Clostridia bacterium]MBS5021966.1 F0F1 ATP synthase subunit epsilon [Bacillota bacterium]